MPGLYPVNQNITIFGEEVLWPGVDPVSGKFTNGSFTDPLVRPSYVPADTMNLLLDNIGNLLEYLGFEPNNTDPEQLKKAFHNRRPIGELRLFGFEPTPLQLATWRCLPLKGQMADISLYQDLCNLKYCGDENNNTAEWWYKASDPDGLIRDINGAYMRILDHQGIGIVGAGSQMRTITWTDTDGNQHTVDTLYDGKEIGGFQGDRIRDMAGIFGMYQDAGNQRLIIPYTDGALFTTVSGSGTEAVPQLYSAAGTAKRVKFDPSKIVPTGPYNQPAAIAAQICMTY
jgi:hypothetical protein